MILLIVFLVAMAAFWFVLWWDVESDYQKWLSSVRGGPIIEVLHKKEFWERYAYLMFPYLCFLSVILVRMIHHGYGTKFTIVASVLVTVFAMGSLYMLLFDGWYNAKRGFGWWFNGSPKGKTDDSRFDIFWRTLSDTLEALFKIGATVVLWGLYAFFCFF